MIQELRFTMRTLRRNAGFSLIVVATLAIGIAVNLLLVILVDALLFRSASGYSADGVVAIYGTSPTRDAEVSSYSDFLDFRAENTAFARLAAWKGQTASVTISGGTESARAMLVSAGYFEALGLAPLRGRFIAPAEDRTANGDPVAVITESFWRSRLAGDEQAVGRELTINDLPFRIIGVLPAGFHGTLISDRAEIFVPMTMQPHMMPSSGNLLGNRGWSGVNLIGRLKPGVSLEAARANLALLAAQLAKQYPDTNEGRGVALMPLSRAALPPSMRAVVVKSSAALAAIGVTFLLLICMSVANLLLVRSVARGREVAIRLALGAGRFRVARQFTIEALLLAACGAFAGTLACWFVLRMLRASVPLLGSVTFNGAALVAVPVLAILTGLISAVAPAFAASSSRLQTALRTTGVAGGRGFASFAGGLVVVQVALSLFLLVSAGLLVRSLMNLRSLATGYDTEHLLVTDLDLSRRTAPQSHAEAYFRTVLERVRAIPNVGDAALGNEAPLTGGGDTLGVWKEGAEQRGSVSVAAQVVGEGYFRTLGTPLVRGREFATRDGRGAPPVAIVNQKLARELWQTDDVVGRRVSTTGPGGPFLEIVGVVSDSRFSSLRDAAVPTVYAPQAQMIEVYPELAKRATLFVRTSEGDPSSLMRDLRALLRAIDAGVPLADIRTVASLRAEATMQEGMLSVSATGLSALALLLAGLGLYGVMSFSVVQRTRELAIRSALGATGAEIVRIIMLRGAVLTLAGIAAGIVVFLAARRFFAAFLYETHSTDPTVWLIVATVLALTMTAATWLPSRRASRIDPAAALQCD
jgi:putative ABC transport system permease protein